MLEELKQKKVIWAIDAHTLAAARRAFDTNEIVGITRMDIRSDSLRMRAKITVAFKG
jgi:hypothetical protein